MEELGVAESAKDMGRVSYDEYIRNGLMTQLIRIKLGDDVEQAHMRNRQMVSKWVYEKGISENVIEKVKENTYFTKVLKILVQKQNTQCLEEKQ